MKLRIKFVKDEDGSLCINYKAELHQHANFDGDQQIPVVMLHHARAPFAPLKACINQSLDQIFRDIEQEFNYSPEELFTEVSEEDVEDFEVEED